MATPLFVVGKHRSGTTWLANLLCELPHVAGIQHTAHFGIHESGYFSYVFGRFGDLRDQHNFGQYISRMAATDYFRLAGATAAYLESLWPASYGEIFRAVMDRYAASQGASHWVEKSPSHTPLIGAIAAEYPDSLFVAIRRDLGEVLSSTMAIWTPGAGPLARLKVVFRTTASWEFYNKCLSRFASGSTRILLVEYADLRQNTSATLARICEFAGLPFDGVTPTCSYEPNTSYSVDGESRAKELRPMERWTAGLTRTAVGLVPAALLSGIYVAWRWMRAPSKLPDWFFVLEGEATASSSSNLG